MLIKAVDKKGNPIPPSPEEAMKASLGRAVKSLNTLGKVFCLDPRNIKVDGQVKSLTHQTGLWEAWAEGVANIGFMESKTNHFHKPVPHTFKIHYRLTKDELGLPDVEMAEPPVITPVERDPSKTVGPLPVNDNAEIKAKAAAVAEQQNSKRKSQQNQKQNQ